MSEKRSNFTGKIGFVLAAAGSAVGLGNIWRFPYLAAKYGGGIFLLVYLVLVVTLGFSIMAAEIAIGRKTGKSAIDAFSSLSKKYTFIGIIIAIVPAIILPYYSVIGGWILKYFSEFLVMGSAVPAADGFFNSFIASPIEPLIWFFIFMGATALIVLFGVEKGIEKVSKVMMPLLAILTIAIVIYTVSLPGALDGVLYYITPKFSEFSVTTVLAAMGQMFYSMSLAMGIMITYGSYMKKDVSIEKSVRQIEIFDTAFAFLAGLMIVPAVFVFSGGDIATLKSGPGLMFMTLPKVFDSMIGGRIIGALFFLLVFFAAITSSISLMETVVSIVCDKFKVGRKLGCLIVFIFCLVLGSLSSLGFGPLGSISVMNLTILDMLDFVSNSVIMPIVAFLTCIFVGYIIKPDSLIEEISQGKGFKSRKLFVVIIKYVAPICIVLILISSILNGLGIITI